MSPEEKELFNEFTTTIEAIESSVYEKKLEPLVRKNHQEIETITLKNRELHQEILTSLHYTKEHIWSLDKKLSIFLIILTITSLANLILLILVYLK